MVTAVALLLLLATDQLLVAGILWSLEKHGKQFCRFPA